MNRNSSSASTPSSSTHSTVPSANSKRMRSNAAGARTDVAWEYGMDLGCRKVKCNFCMEECTGGVFRFKHHLARTHQNVSACTKVPEDVKVKIQNILEQNELNSRKRKGVFTIEEVEQPFQKGKVQQNTLNKIFKKDEREKVCQQIARFFYTSALSFNCVKNPEFVKMVQMIGEYGRGLDPPSYHEMRVTFLNKEVDYTKSLLEDYKNEWKRTGCTLMSDGWSDRKNRSICNFLVNSPRGTIFLASIDTSEISKTKEKVFAMLDDFVEKIARLTRKEKSPADWWDSFGDDTPELKQFAIRVLSLTCSSSGCERNWSAFEMVHSKRRNRLQQQKMNDLVYVMYNLKLIGREERKQKEEDFYFEDVDSDDEWITEDNEDLTNVYENESTTHGDSGDDDFLEEAIRNQYGGNEQSREESNYIFEEGNEVDAMAQLEIID
ncbi:SCAN domain-containing protein [Tanacetum coccineum]|uniref:SCAN domain-containing protein n=1 Tax=Tanacetum coccineum TaxID=301880 RepID=A0ABQ5B5M5_9ASTR